MKCRFCGEQLQETFVWLGVSPVSNSYIKISQVNEMEPTYPLHTYVCKKCFLVQLDEFQTPIDIFSDYAYFSSYSKSWLQHAENYTIAMIKRFYLDNKSNVVEIASNDGYLLQYFQAASIPVLGIEPAVNVAKIAQHKGIETITKFFGTELAKSLTKAGRQADLLLGNNVLAHVPDINDFVEGMHILLKPDGIITMEFPHLLNLMNKTQFDTIYHEHFSYLSFSTVKEIFNAHGLTVFDVEEWSTHGGSLRIFACHTENVNYAITNNVEIMLEKEIAAGLRNIKVYRQFTENVNKIKRDLLTLLIKLKAEDKQIVAYGAPAKGNTLLNYCGIRTDFIDYTVDKNPYKQNCYLPGSRIPIFSPDKIAITKPDYILILPWNLQEEIIEQLSYTKAWQAKFILPIPRVEVI